jgi:peptidoglycan/xylan/chitin deacetylase (PgdA/CDA1 family)
MVTPDASGTNKIRPTGSALTPVTASPRAPVQPIAATTRHEATDRHEATTRHEAPDRATAHPLTTHSPTRRSPTHRSPTHRSPAGQPSTSQRPTTYYSTYSAGPPGRPWTRRFSLPREADARSIVAVVTGLIVLSTLVGFALAYWTHPRPAAPSRPGSVTSPAPGGPSRPRALAGQAGGPPPAEVAGKRSSHSAGVTFGPYGSVRTTGGGFVALTFDDGPNPIWTPRILEILRQSRVTATFCLIGTRVQAYPWLVREIVAAGHTLCNHSWSHNVRLGKLNQAAIREDLQRTNEAIRAAVPGARIPYFRQPGGAWTTPVVTVARELGMTALHWSQDTRDWTRPAVAILAARVVGACQPGAIVLMHDGGGNRSSTVDALALTLPILVREHTIAALSSAGL